MALVGDPATTSAHAARVVAGLDDVLFADGAAQVRSLLGRSFDAVVVDLHAGLDADLLGLCHGLVRGGGALVLRMPEAPPVTAALAVAPFTAADVGTRFVARLTRTLDDAARATPDAVAVVRCGATDGDACTALGPIAPATPSAGTRGQRRVVDELRALFARRAPSFAVLTAPRGRGKSSALGLALREARAAGHARVVVTAADPEAVSELRAFAGEPPLPFADASALASRSSGDGACADVVVVDEAARLPVPLLRALVARHPQAAFAFATTTHGYEGSGRGFSLRFLPWLEREAARRGVDVTALTLDEPIRWAAGCPVEALVSRALCLDAELAELPSRARDLEDGAGAPRVLSPDELASDERLLASLVGLLVHAHYRTTPGDVQRLLDAPNLAVHAVVHRGDVVAATLVAREGGLDPMLCRELARGAARVRGHALADTLVTHAGRPDAGTLTLIRSVRIAVHPALRRRGLARALVEHVHATYAPDLFGTLFGATPELVAFRRAVGYALVRLGTSRGARTGEPTAVMLRPVSARARALVDELRAELARDLPLQLALLDADGALALDPALAPALLDGLPPAPALDDAEVLARVRSYLDGPRPFEAVAYALTRFVEAHATRLPEVPLPGRAVVEARVLHRRSWDETAAAAGLTVPAAMRALRPAIAALAALAVLVDVSARSPG